MKNPRIKIVWEVIENYGYFSFNNRSGLSDTSRKSHGTWHIPKQGYLAVTVLKKMIISKGIVM